MNLRIKLSYALKSLKSNRLCSVISIVGLGLGLICVIVISKYVYQEYTTDCFHKKYNRIYCCTSKSSTLDMSALSGSYRTLELLEKYPSIEDAVCLRMYDYKRGGYVIKEEQIYRGDVLAADSTFYKIFDFPMVAGDLKVALADPTSMVITEQMAVRVFGKKNVMGEVLKFWGQDYRIAGIMKDLPVNSSLVFDVVVPTRKEFYTLMASMFITLKEGTNITTVNKGYKSTGPSTTYIPFRGMYFRTDLDRGMLPTLRVGNAQSLIILLLIGGVILVISLFNYVNIYNVTLMKRNREMGVKRVFGGNNRMLWEGFFYENLVRVFFSVLLGVGLLLGLSGFIEQEVGISVVLNYHFDFLLLIGILILLPLLTSVWPFLKFRHMNPADAIRRSYSGKASSFSRQMLLGLQYIMTTVMIIVAFYFVIQLHFMLNRDIGLNRKNIMQVQLFTDAQYIVETASAEEINRYFQKFWADKKYVQEELLRNPALQHVCYGSFPLDFYKTPWQNKPAGVDYSSCAAMGVTPGFDSLYGLKLKEGRFFNREMDHAQIKRVVVNEAAWKLFNLKDLSTARITNESWGEYEVIGVVKDFRFEHLSKKVQPLLMLYFDDMQDGAVMMHVTEGKEQEALLFLEKLYRKVSAESDFSYRLFEDRINVQYKEDQRIVKVFSLFTVIAIVISAMGLFGFSVFDTQQRYKEIGIRKVNGATIGEVISLLTFRFLLLVGGSFVVACPLSYWIISRYMEHFSERAPLSWWLFVGAGLITVLVAFITLFWQSYRASAENPVKALKSE